MLFNDNIEYKNNKKKVIVLLFEKFWTRCGYR